MIDSTAMPESEYTLTQDRIVVMADLVRYMDLDQFLRHIEATKKMAPMLDQAIYTDLRDYHAIQEVARAALSFKRSIAEIRDRWRKRRARRILKGESE